MVFPYSETQRMIGILIDSATEFCFKYKRVQKTSTSVKVGEKGFEFLDLNNQISSIRWAEYLSFPDRFS